MIGQTTIGIWAKRHRDCAAVLAGCFRSLRIHIARHYRAETHHERRRQHQAVAGVDRPRKPAPSIPGWAVFPRPDWTRLRVPVLCPFENR